MLNADSMTLVTDTDEEAQTVTVTMDFETAEVVARALTMAGSGFDDRVNMLAARLGSLTANTKVQWKGAPHETRIDPRPHHPRRRVRSMTALPQATELETVARTIGDRFVVLFEQAVGHEINPAMRDDSETVMLLEWLRDHSLADFDRDFLPHAMAKVAIPFQIDEAMTTLLLQFYRDVFTEGIRLSVK